MHPDDDTTDSVRIEEARVLFERCKAQRISSEERAKALREHLFDTVRALHEVARLAHGIKS